MPKAGQRSLTPDDWARAALAAIARGGLDAVSVERIASELGATKGSFYWHFKNRDALLDAALERWERRTTETVIEQLDQLPSPADRMRSLMKMALGQEPNARAELALLGSPDHPAARRAIRQAAHRRIGYIAEQFEQLGWSPEESLGRAVVSYYLFLGHLQMSHVLPDLIGDEARGHQLELVLDGLVAEAVPKRQRRSRRASTR